MADPKPPVVDDVPATPQTGGGQIPPKPPTKPPGN